MNKTLAQLHEKGFRLSLDDFGSGYSSLNVLAGIQVDEVKFDKDFLLESAPDKKEKNKLALKNVVKLAKDLQITTVAEGVEVQQDEEFVHSIGCEYGQGFFYSCPIPPEEFAQRYRNKKTKGKPRANGPGLSLCRDDREQKKRYNQTTPFSMARRQSFSSSKEQQRSAKSNSRRRSVSWVS